MNKEKLTKVRAALEVLVACEDGVREAEEKREVAFTAFKLALVDSSVHLPSAMNGKAPGVPAVVAPPTSTEVNGKKEPAESPNTPALVRAIAKHGKDGVGVRDLAKEVGRAYHSVAVELTRLRQRGDVKNKDGRWFAAK